MSNQRPDTTAMNDESRPPGADAIGHIRQRLADDQCIILDGAIATELQRLGDTDFRLSDDSHWGFDALHDSPAMVGEVHASYLAAGAEVLTTNTYSVLEAPSYIGNHNHGRAHWIDLARVAIQLPRQAVQQAGKQESAVVAFSIGGDIETEQQRDTVELLVRMFEHTAPDLILFETLSVIEDYLTLDTIERLVQRGFPVWTSFRRCRDGLCGIHGQLWGGPEGDRFGRLTQRLEKIGVEAVLINCLPIERVAGTLAWLRDFTDLPLGVYPNVGRYVESGWKFDPKFDADAFVSQALAWREEGAQIIGGCCGVGPTEIALVSQRLVDVPRGRRPVAATEDATSNHAHDAHDNGWRDNNGRKVYPLPLPSLVVDHGVFVPTQGSYLIWKFLFNENIGANLQCLDIGCGVGILAIQLALNGATQVTAIDIQAEAVENTMTNAFRNGVAEKITGNCEDLYSFTPSQKYDLVVASLYQMPTDPRGRYGGHRDVDYWGRNLLDHLISELPNYLEEDGVAYLMQVSMLGAERTESELKKNGYAVRVVDFNLYHFNSSFNQNLGQIKRVEQLSDAYHFSFGENENAMVMYLLEVKKAE